MRTCFHSPRVEFVSLSPVELLYSSPTGFHSQMLWAFLLLIQAWCGTQNSPVGELLWYNCFPVCELPTQGFWDLSYLIGFLVFVFGYRISFLIGSSLFFFFFKSMLVKQLVVILVHSWEEVSSRSFSSAILWAIHTTTLEIYLEAPQKVKHKSDHMT